MEDETFLVIFNSQGKNATINNVNNCNITYDVKWSTILPIKFSRFHCQMVFKSVNYTTSLLSDNGFVNLTLGNTNVYDGLQKTTNIGMIYPVIANNTVGSLMSYYNSTNNDNNDFIVDYPTINQVVVTLKKFDNTTDMTNMPNYVIYLSLKGVK